MKQLRDFQLKTVKKCIDTKEDILISAPTGCGKTYIAEMIIFELSKISESNFLFIVPRIILIQQFLDELTVFKNSDFDIIQAENTKLTGKRFIIASKDSLDKYYSNLPKNLIIFIDEVHEGLKQSYELVQNIKPVRVFGFTATPERNDGYSFIKGVDLENEEKIHKYGLFDKHIDSISIKEAQNLGYLCDLKYVSRNDLDVLDIKSKGTNELAKIPTSSRAITAQFTYHPEVNEGELFTSKDVKVTVKEFDNSSSLGKSILFFYNILCKYTKDISVKTNVSEIENKESREVYLDLDDFISSFGVPDRKKAVQRLKEYYETLKNITLDFEEFNPKDQTVKKYSLEIFSGKGTEQSLIKRSKNYFFILNYDLVKYLVERNYITYFPNRAFGIDVMRYPNALSVTNKLSVMYSENYWKSNKGLISLEKLLESVSDIPSFETVRQTNRHYYDRIIEPLEKTMDYLKDMKILQDWEWCNKKRSPLTDEQIQGYGYAALKECYIKYEMADYPDDIMKLRKEKIDAKKEKKVKKGGENLQ